MPTRRYYANAAPTLTLSAGLTSSGTSATVSGTFSGWPVSYPYFAALEAQSANLEIVLVTAVAGSIATITRGQGGTAAISHAGGATLDQVVVNQDFDEANAHTSASGGVHGIAGSVVGTTDAQTLTNKTLTSPTLSSPTVTGTLAGVSETLSGALTVTGATATGPLTVTGAAHVSSTTTLTGEVTTGAGLTVAADVTAGASAVKLNKPPLCVVSQASVQSIPNSTATGLTFDTETVDTANGHSTSVNNNEYVAAVAGWYSVVGTYGYASNAAGVREVMIVVNGAILNQFRPEVPGSSAGTGSMQVMGVVFLNVGDWVGIDVIQTSGGALNTVTGFSGMTVQWISD